MTIQNNEFNWSFSLKPEKNINDEICLHWRKEPRIREPNETDEVIVKIRNV